MTSLSMIQTDKRSQTDNGSILIRRLMDSIKEKKRMNLVCYVDDPECDLHVSAIDEHQESPGRTKRIREFIKETGLDKLLFLIGSSSVGKKDLSKTHDKDYVETLINCGKKNTPVIIPSPSSEVSMSNIQSLNSIFAAVGSVFAAIQTVCGEHKIDSDRNMYNTRLIKKVFCNVRPPGHHAHHRKGAGFCFLNNVALGATMALDKYPQTIKKVLIFDWDLHHGDGTEDIFRGNPNVMYVSFHRGGEYGRDKFYPGTGSSEVSQWDNIHNYPIGYNESMDVDSYMDKFNNRFLPKAYEFDPDLVIISAGFDSHKDDLYHELPLDYIHYHEMTKSLMKLADHCSEGRLISVLEGGYSLDVLSKSVAVHLATMIDGY
jgi:acetoin utilization deacetylase AcuC-like enzyme